MSSPPKKKATHFYINITLEQVKQVRINEIGSSISTTSMLNGLDISNSIFNRITKCDMKWHPYTMHV